MRYHNRHATLPQRTQVIAWHMHAEHSQQSRHAEHYDRTPLQPCHQPVRPHLPQHRRNEAQHEDCDTVIVPADIADAFMHQWIRPSVDPPAQS